MTLSVLFSLLAGCAGGSDDTGAPPSPVVADPPSGSSFGYTPVTLDLSAIGTAAADVLAVTLGGIAAYDLTPLDDSLLQVTVQGAPTPGPADLVLTTAAGSSTWPRTFTYNPPVDPAFDRLAAIGASYTEGVVDGAGTYEGALASPGAVVARQAGAWFGLPLLPRGFFQPIQVEQVGAPPLCTFPSYVENASDQLFSILASMRDPETGLFSFSMGRVDATLEPRNHGVAGARVDELLFGTDADDMAEVFLDHLINEPVGEVTDPTSASQVERIESDPPDLLLVFDAVGNNLVDAMVYGETGFDVSLATPIDQITPWIDAWVARVAATGAQVFLATQPPLSLWPLAEDVRWKMQQNGYSEAEILAAQAQMDTLGQQYNDAMARSAAAYPNVHLVDLVGIVQQGAAEGVDVGDAHLTMGRFGGIIGLDGLHFSHTGYGILGNLFIRAINAELGLSIPEADLEEILATDPDNPASLAAAGLDAEACTGP